MNQALLFKGLEIKGLLRRRGDPLGNWGRSIAVGTRRDPERAVVSKTLKTTKAALPEGTRRPKPEELILLLKTWNDLPAAKKRAWQRAADRENRRVRSLS
jgi:hypothetical protein